MPTPASQRHAFNHLAREKHLHEEAEEVIRQHPLCDSGVIKVRNATLWPPNLRFQLIDRQRRRMEQRRRGTPGDIVAGEGKGVDQDGKDEGNPKGAQPMKISIIENRESEGAGAYGPANS